MQVGPTAIESVPVASPEDIILQKLRWYKASEYVSERQWRDILGVLKIRDSTLDKEYLRRQAVVGEFAALLEQAFTAI